MVAISTFVIFDIETTGLPRHERNRTKITELTFLAVDTRDIERTACGLLPPMNKLSYLFNPQRNIHPEVSELTGLTNSLLMNQPIFKNKIRSLTSFLDELPNPVCLVAHNGNSFDFKILRSEFLDAGAILPENLLCVDSLWGFKKILKETNLCHESILTVETKFDDELLTDDEEWPELNTSLEEWEEIDRLVETFSKVTPGRSNHSSRGSFGKVNSKTDVKEMNKTTVIESVFAKKPRTENTCYTLQALYKRLLNKDAVNAHRSEADCLMLLECVVALKKQFLPYAYNKCKLLSAVKPFEPY